MPKTGHSEPETEQREIFPRDKADRVVQKAVIPLTAAFFASIGGMWMGASTVANNPGTYPEFVRGLWYIDPRVGGLVITACFGLVLLWAYYTVEE